MTDTIRNFGVPLGDGTRGGILMPLMPYRFRVDAGPSLNTVTANVESAVFDFAKNQLTVRVRQPVTADSFLDILRFSSETRFSVDALDGTSEILFSIQPKGLKLVSHEFPLDYRNANSVAYHTFTYTFDDLTTGKVLSAAPAEPDGDPRFPTPQEVLAGLKEEPEVLELDLEQEMRITPDNPDSDGDGVPDKLDKHPKDPKKH